MLNRYLIYLKSLNTVSFVKTLFENKNNIYKNYYNNFDFVSIKSCQSAPSIKKKKIKIYKI